MSVSKLHQRADEVFPSVLATLEDLIRIPSVSAASFDQSQLQRSAEFISERLQELGCEVEICTAINPDGLQSRPAILAHKAGPQGAPTVLLYAHHDVQPPGAPEKWTSPAFEPTQRNGRLYGRGSADDGAGIAVHLGALKMWLEDLPVNVTIFIEGEEEIGSPTFRSFLEKYRQRLAADVIVVADSGNWKVGEPALTTGLRGVVDLELEVKVLDHAVHSGFFGGPILDAVTLLCRMIATLHDEQGSVAVPGLVREERAEVQYPEADFRQQAGAVEGLQLAGRGDLAARIWSQPAISVIGMDVTPVAAASNTIIPQATAKISMRIAPGQDPAQAMAALRQYLQAQVPFGAQVSIREGEAGPTYRAQMDSPAVEAAHWALTEGFGHPAVNIGQGGSIPFIADLVEVFPSAQVLVTGVEDPGSQAHSEDESLDINDLKKEMLSEALLLGRIGGVC